MPTLILPPRYTPDSIIFWRTAIDLGWEVERLQNWRISEDKSQQLIDPFIYGEPLFAKAIAQHLSIQPIDPSPNWLATLPGQFLKRQIEFVSFQDVDRIIKPAFIKPAAEKYFPAKVYQLGKELSKLSLSPDIPVLVCEPVNWEIEFRCFVSDRSVKAISSY